MWIHLDLRVLGATSRTVQYRLAVKDKGRYLGPCFGSHPSAGDLTGLLHRRPGHDRGALVISSFSSSKRLTGLTDIRSEDGPPTVNREYTEASGDEWMILSAKHGSSTRRTSFAGRPMSPSRAERPRSDGTYFDELEPDCNQSPRLITALRLSLTVRPHG